MKGVNMDDSTEEVYFYDSMDDAVDAMEIMRAERACELAFNLKTMANGHVKMTVEVGEIRG